MWWLDGLINPASAFLQQVPAADTQRVGSMPEMGGAFPETQMARRGLVTG
jgi:hypothetical protein